MLTYAYILFAMCFVFCVLFYYIIQETLRFFINKTLAFLLLLMKQIEYIKINIKITYTTLTMSIKRAICLYDILIYFHMIGHYQSAGARKRKTRKLRKTHIDIF